MSTPLDGFHFALNTRLAQLDRLEEQLRGLIQHHPPLHHLCLCSAIDDGGLVALLSFANSRDATVNQPVVRALANALQAQLINLETLDASGRASFERYLDHHPHRATGLNAFNEVRHLTSPAPILRLDFDDLEQLFTTWARAVTEGGLFVPSPRSAHVELFRLDFVVASQEFPGSTAIVRREKFPGRDGKPGFWLDVTPSPDLKALFDRRARQRHQGRPSEAPPPGVVRQAPRFDTMLEVRFDDLSSLAAQWATDISHGGMFVSCQSPPDLRTRLSVHVTLPDQAETTLAAEVVHRILSGSRPGVGVQFLPGQDAALTPLIELIDDYQRRQPRVLVVDDEAIWRSSLARALTSLGCDVQLACDGRDGLLKLIEGYFDLDLVILDLHMPNLDGRGLIERVRQQGGDSGLKMFLFSAAPPEELQKLAATGLATGVFSKLDSLDSLTARIAHELGLTPAGEKKKAAA